MPEEQKEKDKEPEPERDNTLRNYILGGFILAAVAGQVVSSRPSMMLITMDLSSPWQILWYICTILLLNENMNRAMPGSRCS